MLVSALSLDFGLICLIAKTDSIGSQNSTTDLYVAPEGDDASPGTIEKPFATLLRARDAVRELKENGLKGDISVFFREGSYFFSEPVVLSRQDSGSNGQKITYSAYPGETPVFTSGIHITGWQKITRDDPGWRYLPSSARDSVYVADIPGGLGLPQNLVDHNSDWLDQARMDVTEYVTTEHFKHGTSVEGEMWDPPEEKKLIEFSKSMEGLSNAADALSLRIYPSDFNMNLLPVESIQGNQLYTKVPGTYRLAIVPWGDWKGKIGMCWIENLLEGLDGPGKWVCNTETGKIYLWPEGDTTEIYAPALTEFIRVEGDIDYKGVTDIPVEYVTFQGITFTNGERAVWEEGDAGLQHDWGMADKANALLRFRGVENCVVRDCIFEKSGGVGVRFDLHAQNNTVENCCFSYLGYEAVQFCGYGVGAKDVSKRNRFAGNVIHHVGQIKWDSPAITVWNSGYNHISHNYIHHCPYKGVLLSAPRSRAFTQNTTMREQAWGMARWDEVGSEAHAKIVQRRGRRVDVDDQICAPYRYLRGNVVEKNVMHDMSEGMWGDGIFYVTGTGSVTKSDEANKIICNVVYNTDGRSELGQQTSFFRGMYLDGFIGNFEVHRNVWHNCEMMFEGNFLALWYGETHPRANVFCNVSCGSETPIVPTGKRVHPRGTLVFDDDAVSPQHQPSRDCLKDYHDILEFLSSESFPGDPADLDEVREKLAQVIEEMGSSH